MLLGGGVLGGVLSYFLTFLHLNIIPSYLLLLSCLSVLFGLYLMGRGVVILFSNHLHHLPGIE